MPIQPSPFLERTFPEQKLFLWVDGVDLTPFADRKQLANAAKTYSQGDPETFKVVLRKEANVPGQGTQRLPVIREGMIPVVYHAKLGEDLPFFDDFLRNIETFFGGLVASPAYDDGDINGTITLNCVSPTKPLKRILRFVRFDPNVDENDVKRIIRLGKLAGLRDYDFSLQYTPNGHFGTEWVSNTGVILSHNITFPRPVIVTGDNEFFYISGETEKVYPPTSIEDILRDIMSDPGYEADDNWPVPVRRWRWMPDFRNWNNKTEGVIWRLSMQSGVLDGYVQDQLSDAPYEWFEPDTDGLLYDQGASINIDYTPVVRRVVVSGAVHHVGPLNNGPVEFRSRGDIPPERISRPSAGWVRKEAGADETLDTHAIGCNGEGDADDYSLCRINSDFDFQFQIQETYAVHDTFHGANTAPLKFTAMYDPNGRDPGFPPGLWLTAYLDEVEATHNIMCRRDNLATPFFPTGKALSLADANAATCIIRGTPGSVGEGSALVIRGVRNPTTQVLESGIVLYCEASHDWNLYEYDSGTFNLLSAGSHATNAGDGHLFNIKINAKYDQIQVFFDDAIDDNFTQEDYGFNQHKTMHGVGCLADPVASDTSWSDFSVTQFFATKYIGVGEALTGEEWFWIGYGYAFNTDGTHALIQGGLQTGDDSLGTLGVGDYGQPGASYSYATLAGLAPDMPADVPYLWADIEAAHDAIKVVGYDYESVYKITGVLYDHNEYTAGATDPRFKVQWWIQPAGEGEAVLLREQLYLPHDVIKYINTDSGPPQPTNYWVPQASFKDLGATFTACTVTNNYSNEFIPTGDLAASLTPLVGDYPAVGAVEHERFYSYIKRHRVAHAIFKQYGEPRIDVSCVVHPSDFFSDAGLFPWPPGYLLLVSNRVAGWVIDDEGDHRKKLRINSVEKIENKSYFRPDFNVLGSKTKYSVGWRVKLSNQTWDISDPTHTHLTAYPEDSSRQANLNVPESIAGTTYFIFRDPIDIQQQRGVKIQMRAKAVGATAWLPYMEWESNIRTVSIPAGYLAPGTAYEAQHRTIGQDGKPSEWSPVYRGTMPPHPAYSRPYHAEFPIGDGVQAIAITDDSDLQQELQLNEAAALVGWSIVHNAVGGLTVDVEWAGERERRENGISAFSSLSGTGTKPYTDAARHNGDANQGKDFRGWHEHHALLEAGDWLRVVVTAVSGGVTATTGTVVLTFQRRDSAVAV